MSLNRFNLGNKANIKFDLNKKRKVAISVAGGVLIIISLGLLKSCSNKDNENRQESTTTRVEGIFEDTNSENSFVTSVSTAIENETEIILTTVPDTIEDETDITVTTVPEEFLNEEIVTETVGTTKKEELPIEESNQTESFIDDSENSKNSDNNSYSKDNDSNTSEFSDISSITDETKKTSKTTTETTEQDVITSIIISTETDSTVTNPTVTEPTVTNPKIT